MARGLDLDLVEVAPMANPPVCRIMDYGKFRYEEAQKAKESRRKSSNVSVKEVKFRPKIGRGDFDTKVRKVDRVHRRRPQGQGHAAVPGPRDGPPGARHARSSTRCSTWSAGRQGRDPGPARGSQHVDGAVAGQEGARRAEGADADATEATERRPTPAPSRRAGPAEAAPAAPAAEPAAP